MTKRKVTTVTTAIKKNAKGHLRICPEMRLLCYGIGCDYRDDVENGDQNDRQKYTI